MANPHRSGADDLNTLQLVAQQNYVYQKSADATLKEGGGIFVLASGVDVTLPTPQVGMRFRFLCPDSTADATVICASGSAFDASGNTTATLAEDDDTLEITALSSTRWWVLDSYKHDASGNLDTISFSGA